MTGLGRQDGMRSFGFAQDDGVGGGGMRSFGFAEGERNGVLCRDDIHYPVIPNACEVSRWDDVLSLGWRVCYWLSCRTDVRDLMEVPRRFALSG